MNQSTNARRARPIFWAGLLPVLLSTALIGPFEATAQARPAADAQQIRVALPSGTAALAATRRRIAVAARSVCGSGGLAGLYGNAARRCREAVRADAERQLARLAASAAPAATAHAAAAGR